MFGSKCSFVVALERCVEFLRSLVRVIDVKRARVLLSASFCGEAIVSDSEDDVVLLSMAGEFERSTQLQ